MNPDFDHQWQLTSQRDNQSLRCLLTEVYNIIHEAVLQNMYQLSPTLIKPQIYQFTGNTWDQEPGYTTKPGCNNQNAEYNKFSKANKKVSSTKSKGEEKKKELEGNLKLKRL